jgi:type VI secretion system protein ImpL
MLKYIFAFIVVAAVWAAALVIKFPHAVEVAIAVTVLVVLLLVGLFAYRKYRARKAAKEIERALNAQAEEHARSVRPEQQAEVRAMQAEFARAVGSLKSSKLGKSGTEALYALPWYVIIGPPGAGKTTALTNSGSSFRTLAATTAASRAWAARATARGFSPTRPCSSTPRGATPPSTTTATSG